jgi:iron complex transport system substrate-binding protein
MENKNYVTVTAAIAVISVVLSAGVYFSFNGKIVTLDAQVAELTNYISNMEGQITELNSLIVGYEEQIGEMNDELSMYQEVTLVDDQGYVLILTSIPEKIVSLAPSNTEILFAVGAGENVVGVTNYCNYPYNFTAWIEAGNMTSVGGYWNPSVEAIIALDPDLVVASTGSEQAAETLRSVGYNVLTLDPTNINEVFQDIVLVGRATGKSVEAKNLIVSLKQNVDNLVNTVKTADTRPKVYHEIWYDPLMSAGPGTWIDEVIRLAGGQNIFENATSEWPMVSSEAIIQQNPDRIVFPHQHGSTLFWGSFEDVKARPGWEAINAVQNDDLYVVNADVISRAGPRIVEALEIYAEIIHPELFE